ncbi:hypothetical protein CKO15_11400 [Halorhodospira abdelmalekii]|uniref:GGDEF domain-containing protein n=1 Tax=Halorhodospira abdelmalekii TaxID=421629 RepID=UPI001904DDC7|nr:GGDEF domain-containing protein [Halorhodospira abdelmalekii]MBK1735872.1 hypothetical protein [Halorhodospira abdelmalekii]
MAEETMRPPAEPLSEMERYLTALAECHSHREVAQALCSAIARMLPQSSGLFWKLSPDREIWRLISRWSDGAAECIEPAEGAELLPEPAEGQLLIELVAQGLRLGELRVDDREQLTELEQRLLKALASAAAATLAVLVLQRRVRQRNVRDPLTGLFNARYLEDTLARELYRAQRCQSNLTLIRIEPDRISDFIREHSPECADRILQLMADVLHRSFRGSDVCARITDYGFCILLVDAALASGYQRAAALREELSELRFNRRGQTFGPVGVSAGVAAYPEHARSYGELIDAADSAVTRAREEGGERALTAELLRPASLC